jgi:hypothetical protein
MCDWVKGVLDDIHQFPQRIGSLHTRSFVEHSSPLNEIRVPHRQLSFENPFDGFSYYGVFFGSVSISSVHALISDVFFKLTLDSKHQEIVGSLIPKNELHCTLAHASNGISQECFLNLMDNIGKFVDVEVDGIIWDRYAMALVVSHTLGTTQVFPHISYALYPSVKPVYSNSLLAKGKKLNINPKTKKPQLCSPLAMDEEYVCFAPLPMTLFGRVGTALY